MKRKKIIIILCVFLVLLFYIYIDYDHNQLKIDEEDLSLIIPAKKCRQIEKELLSKEDELNDIIVNDSKDGYSLGSGSPSLSKEGIKKIYQLFNKEQICISDEQGYFDLENKEIFEKFWSHYLKGEDSSFIYYEILQTGNIKRSEYCYEDHYFYVIDSELNINDTQDSVVESIHGKQIEEAYFDEYGFFYYKFTISDLMKSFGIIEYEYIKIEPLGEKSRTYKQKYISTIDYQCSNIFTENWNQSTIDKINFSDIYEYLYELKYDSPFYSDDTIPTLDSFVKEIPSQSFETLIQEYFNISSHAIKQYSVYDQDNDAYPWNEGYCIASKFMTPRFSGDIINIDENETHIVLTVYANGYEFGYTHGFTHKIYIEKKEEGFRYIKNEIIETSNDHIPTYTPGVTCQSLLS